MTDPTPLSPAAQAVQGAAIDAYWLFHPGQAAAILRAAADLLSREVDAPKVDGSKYNGLWHSFDYLNAIAAELDGTNNTSENV